MDLMFALTIIAAAILRIYLIIRDSVPFAYDMGRDLLWSKDIAFYHTPTLIGPAASIWGVYFAPLWYYLLSPPLFLTNGHPLSAVYTTAATIILTGLIAFLFFKKYLGKFISLALCSIILFNSTLINLSTFAFHANLLPLLTLLTLIFCFLSVIKNPLYMAAAFFCIGLMFSADPAPAVVFTFVPIFIFFYFKLYRQKTFSDSEHFMSVILSPSIVTLSETKSLNLRVNSAKNLKSDPSSGKTRLRMTKVGNQDNKWMISLISLSIIAYLLPLSPLILFELRNNFIQTKSLISYFAGDNPSLSGQLPLIERIISRVSLYWEFYKQSFAGGEIFLAILFLAISLIGLYKFWANSNRTLKILFKINLIFLILTLLIFTLIVTVEVKGWYIYGLTPIVSITIALALFAFKDQKLKVVFLLLVYLISNLLPFFREDRIEKAKNDPAQLKNQLAAIQSIYDDSSTKPFSVYTFTPSIYDYNYQYLLWWQAKRKDKILPIDFAYLPNIPSYVRNKSFYQDQVTEQNLAYLIIENAKENEFYTKENWLNNFNDYSLIWRKYIDDAITVEKRQK